MKIKLDTMTKATTEPKSVRLKVTSEVVVTTSALTGLPHQEYTLVELVQSIQQGLDDRSLPGIDSWSEIVSDCELWREENWTDFDIEWA